MIELGIALMLMFVGYGLALGIPMLCCAIAIKLSRDVEEDDAQ